MLSYKIREIPDWVFGSIEIDRTTLVSKRYGTSFNGLGVVSLEDYVTRTRLF